MTGTDKPVGAAVTPFQVDAAATIRLAVRAEGLGYASFGAAEGWTHDATVVVAQIAAATERIELATAVLAVWSRTPAAIAMAAASLQTASGGRFVLGLGAGSPPLAEGLHGQVWEQPLARLRSTLGAVRALLDGERLPLARDGVRPLRIGVTPEPRVPIMLAALTPPSIRLAGELADRWLPFLWARSRLADGRALLAEGAARAGRDDDVAVAVSVPLAIAEDEAGARAMAAGWLLAYLTRMGPIYPRLLREQLGFAREVDALLEANAGGGVPVLPAAAEALAHEVTIMAPYSDAAPVVRGWLDAGADSVALVLPPAAPEEQLAEMLDAAAPARASA
jgi:alkanesulfonate monooxygenase SsuD/methylene tetrahydromethanopterin reductase-like flavin-dependent oxidoreductase (luciferase family)